MDNFFTLQNLMTGNWNTKFGFKTFLIFFHIEASPLLGWNKFLYVLNKS